MTNDSDQPRLLFFGDPHGDFAPVVDTVLRLRPAAIVLLGDLQPQRPLEVELAPIAALTDIWWIHGNHDTDSDADYDNLFGSALADRNLHGRVADVAGYRVAGLGGIFRGLIWDPGQTVDAERIRSRDELLEMTKRRSARFPKWRGGIPRKHHSTIFPAEYWALAEQKADILVTHEAPSVNRYGFKAIDELTELLGARASFHGHHHVTLDYEAEGLTGPGAPFRPFGVDKGDYLAWPPLASPAVPASRRQGRQP